MKSHMGLMVIVFVITFILGISSCLSEEPVGLAFTSTETPSLLSTTQIIVINSPTLFDSSTVTLSPTLTLSPSIELVGCLRPSDDYAILTINGHQLNQRTYEMLTNAAQLYQGPIDLIGSAITQGSYTDAVPESFHTHAGGGAVDISVMAPGTFDILYDEIEPLIDALRLAGFAAWFRDFNDIYEGSPVHIHAIAIGDRELSLAAREQLAGPFGYFWGYDGLPQDDNIPHRDPHGGPVLCNWMIEMGYPNKTATAAP